MELLFVFVLAAFYSYNQAHLSETSDNQQKEMKQNVLSESEKAEGWKLLFDGKTLDKWRKYKGEGIGKRWQAKDDALYFCGRECDLPRSEGGDIITKEEFENYELRLDWKISPGGNSGLIYNALEGDDFGATWHTGLEMQILDNDGHSDGKIEKHRAGDLYDLISCSQETVNPVGEWNQVRLVVNNGNIQHWLNGTKVVEIQMWSKEWDDLVGQSKFRIFSSFGKAKKGHLALQDHGDPVWFRNIKIKEL